MNIYGENLVLCIFNDHILYQKSQYKISAAVWNNVEEISN